MGCGGSVVKKGEGAPSLTEYFEKLREYSDTEIEDLMGIIECQKAVGAGKATIEDLKAKRAQVKAKREAFKKVSETLLTESFNHHDVSGDGKLTPDESTNLFSHITDAKTENDTIMAKAELRRMLAITLGMSKELFDSVEVENEEAIKKNLEEQEKKKVKEDEAAIKKQMDDNIADYRKNKAERDKAAFAVLDKSKDGKIEKPEFIAAFDQGSDVHTMFMAALGLNIKLQDAQGEQIS